MGKKTCQQAHSEPLISSEKKYHTNQDIFENKMGQLFQKTGVHNDWSGQSGSMANFTSFVVCLSSGMKILPNSTI